MLTLHNLQRNKKRHIAKRLGRGNASGAGNYSTKGIKGQRARSGGRAGITGRSIKSFLLRIPKRRGFKSLYPKTPSINTGQLNQIFPDGAHINYRVLVKAGLIKDGRQGVKVLAQGELNKKFTVEAKAFSAGAKKQIESAGGRAVLFVSKKSERIAAASVNVE